MKQMGADEEATKVIKLAVRSQHAVNFLGLVD
jgi:hypothetical protein